MAFNELINITFEDAVTYGTTDTSDILGVIMPYHWGPAGEAIVYNRQEFYEAYPEALPAHVSFASTADKEAYYKTYYQIKSFFNNGGSRVAVYRPIIKNSTTGNPTELFGITDVLVENSGLYVALKYPGIPDGITAPTITKTATESGVTVTFSDGSVSETNPAIETFTGQITDPAGVYPGTGESNYLPKIVEKNSKYLQIVTTTPVAIPDSFIPALPTDSLASVFATDSELVPTMFLDYDATIDAYDTSCTFRAVSVPLPIEPAPAISRFCIDVTGKEKIQVFKSFHEIDCNAGVAGAYSNIARQVHLNQIASAQAYGAYSGTLSSSHTFTNAQTNMANGIVTVYNTSRGPQIFGTRNSFNRSLSSSYFARCNVSRVLASILKNVVRSTIQTIHTDTAANPISRKRFETELNNILGSFISTQDLQADSIAICNGSNNSDAQTQGGTILNIILALHFIGLVEKVNIRVIATDSSVTVNFA